MNRSRFAFIVGAAVLGLSALTACAADEKPAAQNDKPNSAEAGTLATADVGDFGNVVVDGSGRTLYVFDKDTADPPKSNCDGDCAAKWPPVKAGSGTPQAGRHRRVTRGHRRAQRRQQAADPEGLAALPVREGRRGR